MLQENKAHQIFPKNEYFLPPDTYTHTDVSGVRNVRFSENLVRFVFLVTITTLPPKSLSPFLCHL